MRLSAKAPFLALVLSLAATLTAHAQLGIYGQFSTSPVTAGDATRLYGGTFGAFYDSAHFPVVNFGLDARGSTQHGSRNGFNTSITSGAVGPRVVFRLPLVPIRPYAEVLVGGAHRYSGPGPTTSDSKGFIASAVAGADLHLLPFIDWRVIDYSFSRVPHASQNSIGTGLVIRIPFS